jgi:hypothetical protein
MDDATSGGVPPRLEDLFRHLDDLRTNSYEGAGPREERVELFRRALELFGPVVRRVLDEANAAVLDGTGAVREHDLAQQPDGGWTARWELSRRPRTSAAATASSPSRWWPGSPPASPTRTCPVPAPATGPCR